MYRFCFAALAVAIFASACSKDSGNASNGGNGDNGGGGKKPSTANRVNWAAVPSEFNPGIDQVDFRIEGVEKISLDIMGFKNDVEVVYANDLAKSSGYLKLYRVSKGAANFGSTSPGLNGKTLDLKSYTGGTPYQCSIQIQNGAITTLKGGCYVRVQVVLPTGSEVEVYNLAELISKRFFAMSNADLLQAIRHASFAKEKFEAIEAYFNSYRETGKTPSLPSQDLGKVVHEFSFKQEKLDALKRLQSIVADRENLAAMIDEEFGTFERDEARAIVGLPPQRG